MGWPPGPGGTRLAGCVFVWRWWEITWGLFVLGVGCGGTSGAVSRIGVRARSLGVCRTVGVRVFRRSPSGLGRDAVLRGASGDSRERLTF